MTSTDHQHRREQLQAEWEEVNEQLGMINDMCTIPWPESPADMEVRLLKALESIEYELGMMDLRKNIRGNWGGIMSWPVGRSNTL